MAGIMLLLTVMGMICFWVHMGIQEAYKKVTRIHRYASIVGGAGVITLVFRFIVIPVLPSDADQTSSCLLIFMLFFGMGLIINFMGFLGGHSEVKDAKLRKLLLTQQQKPPFDQSLCSICHADNPILFYTDCSLCSTCVNQLKQLNV